MRLKKAFVKVRQAETAIYERSHEDHDGKASYTVSSV